MVKTPKTHLNCHIQPPKYIYIDLDSGTLIKNDIELVYEDDVDKYLEYL
jgi:hypothetical protein